MKTFNKYKSHFIAAIGTLSVYGLFMLLLFKPFGNSNSKSQDDVNQLVAIQFQRESMENVPLPPPPSNNENYTDKSAKENPSKEASTSEDVEKAPQSEEVIKPPINKDSVLIAELKKTYEDLKNNNPDDSLPKEKIPQTVIQKNQQQATDNNQNLYEDRKFFYDNYGTIINLKKVYPYVQKTKEIIARLNYQLATMKNGKEKHLLIKKTEKELYVQFEKDVRNMSTSQGKLLLKLIARETDQSAYNIIKTYKGVIPATFWYGVGLMFHENMKLRYDSLGEDAQLEKIVQKYKMGKF